MGFWNKLFGNNSEQKVGGMEDFMTLIRVYFQAAMAADLGITNLAALPDLRVFKTTLKVATVNNKLGVGERTRCKKMLKEMYGMDDDFFKEIDSSLRKRCKKLMKFKLRLPGFMKKALYTMTEKTVNDIFTKNDFTDPAVLKSVVAVREYNRRLGFSQKWVTDFVFKVVMLAKKEPKPAQDDK